MGGLCSATLDYAQDSISVGSPALALSDLGDHIEYIRRWNIVDGWMMCAENWRATTCLASPVDQLEVGIFGLEVVMDDRVVVFELLVVEKVSDLGSKLLIDHTDRILRDCEVGERWLAERPLTRHGSAAGRKDWCS